MGLRFAKFKPTNYISSPDYFKVVFRHAINRLALYSSCFIESAYVSLLRRLFVELFCFQDSPTTSNSGD